MNSEKYFYKDSAGHEIGPFPYETLAKLRTTGVLGDETPVRTGESSEWRPCREIVRTAETVHSQMPTSPGPSPPLSPAAKRGIGIGICLVILAAVAYWVNAYRSSRPSKSAVQQVIEKQLNRIGQQLDKVDIEYLESSVPKTKLLQYSARLELTEALYAHVASSTYLQEQGAPASIYQEISGILTGKGALRIRDLAEVTSRVEALDNWTLLRESAPKGHTFSVVGKILAAKVGDGWRFEPLEQAADSKQPAGQRLAEFGDKTLVLDRPQDVAKAKELVANAKNVLNRLLTAKEQYLAEAKAAQERRLQDALSKIQKGALFSGTASRGSDNPQVLYLEITDINQERSAITALLRNDGGWAEARRFQGAYSWDAEQDLLKIRLSTRSEDALPDCGPFLEWYENWTADFSLSGDALAARSGSGWLYDLKRVADDAKQAEIEKLLEDERNWIEATKAGTVYKVFATLPDRAWSREYLFTFTKQERNGTVIEGELEQRSKRWKRHFRGTFIANRYKAQHKPLRLITEIAETDRQANNGDQSSPLGYAEHIEWYPKLTKERLTLDSTFGAGWHLEFDPLSKEEIEKLADAERAPARTASSVPSNITQPAAPGGPVLPAKPVGPSAAPTGLVVPTRAADALTLLGLAANQTPAGTVNAESTFEGFICAVDGRNISKIRFRLDSLQAIGPNAQVVCSFESLDKPGAKRTMRGVLANGNVFSLQADDGKTASSSDGGLLGGLLKFDVKVNGQSTSGAAARPSALFEGGNYSAMLMLTPSGLTGKIRETDWLMLLQPVGSAAAKGR